MEQSDLSQDQVMYCTAGTSLIIILPPEVDDHNCKGITKDTEEFIQSRVVKRIIFDFTKTGFMDSAGYWSTTAADTKGCRNWVGKWW